MSAKQISLDNFKSGRVHTMITSAFSHMDAGHIISNMIGLYFFGNSVSSYPRFYSVSRLCYLLWFDSYCIFSLLITVGYHRIIGYPIYRSHSLSREGCGMVVTSLSRVDGPPARRRVDKFYYNIK